MEDQKIWILALASTCALHFLAALLISSWSVRSDAYSVVSRGALEVVYVVLSDEKEALTTGSEGGEREEVAVSMPPVESTGEARRALVHDQDKHQSLVERLPAVEQTLSQAATALDDSSPKVSVSSLLGSVRSRPITISERQPWERDPALRRISSPERFRMREQASVEDVVREVSKFLGFWPPGYTDSPCPGLRRALDEMVGLPDVDPEFVREVALAQAKFCR